MGPSMIVDGDARDPDDAAGEQIASMGPSMIVDGDNLELGRVRDQLSASMWPSMIVDGDASPARRRMDTTRASMGPSIIVDGDLSCWSGAPRSGCCFNGAVDDRRRRHGQPCPGEYSWVWLQW